MPTVLISKGYRFFFYSNEHKPMHIHIEKENKVAKFTIEQVELVKSFRYTASELKEIRKLIEKNKDHFKNKWNEYFNG